MAYKWPDKDKDETQDYTVDWSRFLGDDTIGSVAWYIYTTDDVKTEVSATDVVSGLQAISFTNTDTAATIRLGLGTNNVRYKIGCKITTTESLVFERSVFLRIREK